MGTDSSTSPTTPAAPTPNFPPLPTQPSADTDKQPNTQAKDSKASFKSAIDSTAKPAAKDSVKSAFKSAASVAKSSIRSASNFANRLSTPRTSLVSTASANPLFVDLTKDVQETVYIEKARDSYASRISNQRISRWTFIGAMLRLYAMIICAAFGIGLIAGLLGTFGLKATTTLVITILCSLPIALIAIFLCISYTVRRLHDAGHSAMMCYFCWLNRLILFTLAIIIHQTDSFNTTLVCLALFVVSLLISMGFQAILYWFLSKDSEKIANAFGPSPKYISAKVTKAQAYNLIQTHNFSEQCRRAACLLLLFYPLYMQVDLLKDSVNRINETVGNFATFLDRDSDSERSSYRRSHRESSRDSYRRSSYRDSDSYSDSSYDSWY